MIKKKKIYDLLHGFIYLDDLESLLIDTWIFQRLHFIRQLGVAFLVYPGARHSRFEHSLGTMHIATVIYDHITRPTQFINLTTEQKEFVDQYLPEVHSQKWLYYRSVMRLAALLHDVGHLPFSHSAEFELLGFHGHEYWTAIAIKQPEIQNLLKQVKSFDQTLNPVEDVLKIAIGEEKLQKIPGYSSIQFTPWERIVSHIITGDFFGADRIDYLLRDSKNTGLAYGFFDYHQLIETLRIIPNQQSQKLQIGIVESGIESCEALLLARYYMHRRIYQYPSINSYSFHLASFMKHYYQSEEILNHSDRYLQVTDDEILVNIRSAKNDPQHPQHRHAIALFSKENRFKALPVSGKLTLEVLKDMQKQLNIPQSELSWRLKKKQFYGDKTALDFPVLMQKNLIQKAEKISQVSIPLVAYNWIFVSPKYQQVVQDYLNN